MNAGLGKRLARLEAAMPAKLSANSPLSLAACNLLRATIGGPLLTATGYAAYALRPSLAPACRRRLLAQLLDGLAPAG